MSETHIRKVIEERLYSTLGSSVPVAWDNVEFSPNHGEIFIRPFFECVSSRNISLKCERNYYLLTIHVNVKNGSGTEEVLNLSSTIKDAFVYQSFEGVKFQDGVVKRTGQLKEWYQRRVLINLYYNNVRGV